MNEPLIRPSATFSPLRGAKEYAIVFSVHRSLFIVHRSSFIVHRSSFIVHRSLFIFIVHQPTMNGL
jgi:hypothetical protein